MTPASPDREPTRRPSAWAWASASLGYLACASAATYPAVARFGSAIPGELTDPLTLCWTMRWFRSCLIDGRSPFFCAAVQAPVGVPVGMYPAMLPQTLAYAALRLVIDNDAAIFDAIWFAGLVLAGLSTFGLAYWAARDLAGAWVAGLGMMLCGPMLMHARGHLETMQMGAVPPFLVAWIGFVDRPTTPRLLSSAALYALMSSTAPYYAVLAIFPAVGYLIWAAWRVDRGNFRTWAARRIAWLAGFAVATVPLLAVVFGGQVWAMLHHFGMSRSRQAFDHLGAPTWSALVPSPIHWSGHSPTGPLFDRAGMSTSLVECSSYLGVVTLGLLAYAAIARVDFSRRGYWWGMAVALTVLSWGSTAQVGPWKLPMPTGWLYPIFPPLHLIRVPGRFNLFAALAASVPAAAGFRHLVARLPGRKARWAATVGTSALMLVDLAMVPFPTAEIPPPSPFYAAIKATNPSARVLEAPLFDSGRGQVFSSLWGYWQQVHGLETSGGYPGVVNDRFDRDVAAVSPFAADRLDDRAFAADPDRFGPMVGTSVEDQAWLTLTAGRFDYAVIHREPWFDPYRAGLDRLASTFRAALVKDDAEAAILDRRKLKPPTRSAGFASGGWIGRRTAARPGSPRRFAAADGASLTLYRPADDPRRVRLVVEGAAALEVARTIRVEVDGREADRWSLPTDRAASIRSRPLDVPPGRLATVRLVADGASRPQRSADRFDEARTPYAWSVESIRLESSDEP